MKPTLATTEALNIVMREHEDNKTNPLTQWIGEQGKLAYIAYRFAELAGYTEKRPYANPIARLRETLRAQ